MIEESAVKGRSTSVVPAKRARVRCERERSRAEIHPGAADPNSFAFSVSVRSAVCARYSAGV